MSWWILLLVLCSRYCQSAAISCDTKEYEKDGRCCSLCRPGQRLDKDCTESSGTVCVPCKAGEYQDQWNRATECLLHRDCDANLGFQIIGEGTVEKNVDCVCQDGKHCSGPKCETCVGNTPCGPGYGVTRKADKYSDTECVQCVDKTFSNVTSDTEPCKDWQSCTSSQQEIRPGTASTDVVCGPHSKNSTWIVVVVVILTALVISVGIYLYITKRQKEGKVKLKEETKDPPKKVNEIDPFILPMPNLPEEDQDEDQDTTMQGLPVAQEQGKDYHVPEQEVI